MSSPKHRRGCPSSVIQWFEGLAHAIVQLRDERTWVVRGSRLDEMPELGSHRALEFEPSTSRKRQRSLRLKRCVDVLVASGASILFSPFFVLIAIVIRLDSAGPAFFRQVRIGRKQRPFEMW